MPTPLPDLADWAGTPNNATAKASHTSIWNYLSGLFGTTGVVADARTALGLGTAATAASTAFATAAQGTKADSALQPAVIGVSVQGFDASTAKTSTGQTFTAPQLGSLLTDNDLSFDLSAKQHFKCTPTGAGTLTFTNIPATNVLSGVIFLINGANYAIAAHANTKISAADLAAISVTGTHKLGYDSDGTNVYVNLAGSY